MLCVLWGSFPQTLQFWSLSKDGIAAAILEVSIVHPLHFTCCSLPSCSQHFYSFGRSCKVVITWHPAAATGCMLPWLPLSWRPHSSTFGTCARKWLHTGFKYSCYTVTYYIFLITQRLSEAEWQKCQLSTDLIENMWTEFPKNASVPGISIHPLLWTFPPFVLLQPGFDLQNVYNTGKISIK